MPTPCDISEVNFKDEVLRSPIPTLVDFWAPWCAPCREIGPVIEELAGEYADSIKVAKVNVDENPDVASTFGIHSIPTRVLFKEGEVIEQLVGAQPKSEITAALDRAVA